MPSSLSTFKFDEKLTEVIEELKKNSGATSKSEVIRRAIALMKVAQDAHERGEKIVIRSGGDNAEGKTSEREIVIP